MAPAIVKFINGRQATEGKIVDGPLFVNPETGKIVDAPAEGPVTTVDLAGRFLAPGLIDIQLNGCMGINYSDLPAVEDGMTAYGESVRRASAGLVRTGVTSFLPTLVAGDENSIRRALPYMAPTGRRDPGLGAESLGAHCEGPFISPAKKGAHRADSLRTVAASGLAAVEEVYGAENLVPRRLDDCRVLPPAIRAITVAPEMDGMLDAIRHITTTTDVRVAMGHSVATYDQGLAGLAAGASVLTHLFNAMPALHHREPGLVGVAMASDDDLPTTTTTTTTATRLTDSRRPFFGLVADGVHIHPAVARMVFAAHEDGCIVTTDGTAATGMDLPDGVYAWREGFCVEKRGNRMVLAGTDTIAGSSAKLLDCASNLIRWTGVDVARGLKTVTANPARMAGYADIKGTLAPGADADLVVLSWNAEAQALKLHEVWKFGVKVYHLDE